MFRESLALGPEYTIAFVFVCAPVIIASPPPKLGNKLKIDMSTQRSYEKPRKTTTCGYLPKLCPVTSSAGFLVSFK